MSDYYVYIVKCKDNSLYCGITTDIANRISIHNQGKGAKYTRGRTPVELQYFEGPYTKSEALKREIKIKSLTKAQKYQLISNSEKSKS